MSVRWLPRWPLPSRAFIPGQTPRPEALAGPTPLDHPAEEWRIDEAYLFGIDLYEAGFAWEAHEAWEGAWKLATEPARRELLQGLIQCAAAVVKARVGAPTGVRSLVARGTGHLEAAATRAGSPLMGLDLERIVHELRAWAATPTPSPQQAPILRLGAGSGSGAGWRTRPSDRRS
jgi:uncharacterized protein